MEYQKCSVSDICGGCDYQGLSYDKQCQKKQERIEKLFRNIIKVQPIIKSEHPFAYRNKVQVSFGKDEKGKIIVGNYAKESHFLVPINDCMICDEKILEIIRSFRTLLNKYHISVYDEKAGKGCPFELSLWPTVATTKPSRASTESCGVSKSRSGVVHALP